MGRPAREIGGRHRREQPDRLVDRRERCGRIARKAQPLCEAQQAERARLRRQAGNLEELAAGLDAIGRRHRAEGADAGGRFVRARIGTGLRGGRLVREDQKRQRRQEDGRAGKSSANNVPHRP